MTRISTSCSSRCVAWFDKLTMRAVAQRMGRHPLLDAGRLRRLMDRAVELAGPHGLDRAPPPKKPARGGHDAASPGLAPPQPPQPQELWRPPGLACPARPAPVVPRQA